MITRCIDKTVILNILNHQNVIDWLTDDGSPKNHEPVIHPSVTYIIDDSKNGVIRVDPMNSTTAYVHIATTPKMWGTAHRFAKEAIKWGFVNLSFMKYVAIIPEYNDYVLRLVRDIGFEQEGILKKSFLKNWKLHNQLVYSLQKGEI